MTVGGYSEVTQAVDDYYGTDMFLEMWLH
jgi:hypothetical protein